MWSRSLRQRLGYGMICLVIGLGIVATQARGPLLAVLIALPVLLIFSAIKARREKNTQAARSVKVILVAAALAGLVVVGLSTTLFADPWGRYQAFIDSLGQPQGTIALRLALWQTALQTFLDHPLTGIGIGNFRIVHDLYPALRISPLHLFVKGMSAHNVILHYLAETGLLGALSLLWLAGLGLRAGFRVFRMILNSRNAQVSAALFIGMFVFCLTIFYMRAWTWGQGGYVMALLFGLLAAWYEQRRVATPHSGTPAQ